MITIENAIELFDEKYPQVYPSAQMAEHLRILQFIYLFGRNEFSDNIYAFKNYSDIFIQQNFITQKALDHFDSRINDFITLCNSVKELLKNIPSPKDLTLLSKFNIKDQVEYRQLINQAKSFYVIIPKYYNNEIVTVISNDYNWYFGDFDGNSAFNKYSGQKKFLDEKFEQQVGVKAPMSISGYKKPTKTHYFNNVELFEIDNTCFEINLSTISIHRVIINDPQDIWIDQINGGIFTDRAFEPDYYYYLDPIIELSFDKLYCVEQKIQTILDVIYSQRKSPLDDLTENEKRLYVLKKALQQGWIDSLIIKTDTSDIVTSKVNKKIFWEKLHQLKELKTEEARLFTSGYDDFFKKYGKKLHQIIRFKSGRPPQKAN